MRDVVLFSIARVLVFLLPFAVLAAIGLELWVAALIAAAIGLCVSYIFLAPLRHRVAERLAASRAAKPAPGADEAAEDGDGTPTS